MGTNYYLHRNICAHCGRGDQPLHIGKSSVGWCFSLHVGRDYEDEPLAKIRDLDDWRAIWHDGVIRNEYDQEISIADMERQITERGTESPIAWDERPWVGYGIENDFHRINYSERGPRGLLRHRISPDSHCVKHGAGTWDCITGEFS